MSRVAGRDGQTLQVRRDARGMPLWLALPGGQVYWLSLSNGGTLRKVSAQGHDVAHIAYHGNSGLLATKSDENGWTTVYEYGGLFAFFHSPRPLSFFVFFLSISVSGSIFVSLVFLQSTEKNGFHGMQFPVLYLKSFVYGTSYIF